ncbi:MAG: hypothetical protein KTR31_26385 [Myxococcales bacterium]|nr:hypothetical protein [Myxococcales bacterium]
MVLAGLLSAQIAEAGPRRGKARKPVTVPIDIGVGPALHHISGPVAQDRTWHTGIAFSAQAILDKKALRRLKHRIPRQYRRQVLQMDELRISHMLIPRTLWISPATSGATTGMYGIGWRPVSLGLPLSREPVRIAASMGLVLTYAYLHSTTIPSPTHFLRPGIDPGLEIEVPLSKTVLFSLGWRSQLYIPQPVGGSVLEVAPLQESIWHIGQGFFKLHLRFPYEVGP